MSEVVTMGELLVEIMRPRAGMSFYEIGTFLGPFPSGAPGIFIDTVARLGHAASIIGAVGGDEFGQCIIDRFHRDGVATEFIEILPDKATGIAFVTYFEDGSRKYIFHWDGTPAVMAGVPDRNRIKNSPPSFFHLMGCSLMANDEFRRRVYETMELFAAEGARITFDPNIRFELLRGRTVEEIAGPVLRCSSILFPGDKELLLLSGREDIEAAVGTLFERHPLEVLVLKRGRAGCTVYSSEGKKDIPAFSVQEVDPTGAGDCFDAGFLCGLLEGRSLEESARLAAAVGALNTKAFGPMEGEINPQAVARLLSGGDSDEGG